MELARDHLLVLGPRPAPLPAGGGGDIISYRYVIVRSAQHCSSELIISLKGIKGHKMLYTYVYVMYYM